MSSNHPSLDAYQMSCRFCKSPVTKNFCDLGMSPVSNAYVPFSQSQQGETIYPLHAMVCDKCFLVQLDEFESRESIFNSEYAYFSSFSASWLDHCKAYVEKMVERFALGKQSQVIEIASNDGYLLQYFKNQQVPVLGVEPTANTAAVAQEKGIETRVCFFGVETAKKLKEEGVQADLLLGNNVLAHVPDINDFVAGMKIALKPTGVVTMEFPHLLQLMALNQFDTIYHEHFSYLSFTTVEKIFAAHGLVLFDVDELETHGGSLRIYARHQENTDLKLSESVTAMKAKEDAAGLSDIATYAQFEQAVYRCKRELLRFLLDAKQEGKTVVGYGAPAKGNTLLNYCGVGRELIKFTVDRSTHKQGTFLPGVRIPVYEPEKILVEKPDYVLILPWNLEKEIVAQMGAIREWGGKFVVPIPEARIVE